MILGATMTSVLLMVIAYFVWKKKVDTDVDDSIYSTLSPFTTSPNGASTTPPPIQYVDGTYSITSGGLAMAVTGSCAGRAVRFRTPAADKTTWSVQKAGLLADGRAYYTMQNKNQAYKACDSIQYLTVPQGGCNAGQKRPFLTSKQSNPRQYWIFDATADKKYTIQNMHCMQAKSTIPYLQSSGQKDNGYISFAGRTGTGYVLNSKV